MAKVEKVKCTGSNDTCGTCPHQKGHKAIATPIGLTDHTEKVGLCTKKGRCAWMDDKIVWCKS